MSLYTVGGQSSGLTLKPLTAVGIVTPTRAERETICQEGPLLRRPRNCGLFAVGHITD